MAEKLWFKIGEAAGAVGVLPRDIRYWEKIIPEIRPRRSKGNLRYYHRDDLPRLLAIHRWIESGFSAADCRELLLRGHVEHDLGMPAPEGPAPRPRPARPPGAGGRGRAAEAGRGGGGQAPAPPPLPRLEGIIDALKDIRGRLERPLP
jgi:DNA-binding transcriptional MerR regulator